MEYADPPLGRTTTFYAPIPYKRIGEPQEIGRAAAWLASDDSDYVHGITLFIDGGMTLYPGFEAGGGRTVRVCATAPPAGRRAPVNGLEAWVEATGEAVALSRRAPRPGGDSSRRHRR